MGREFAMHFPLIFLLALLATSVVANNGSWFSEPPKENKDLVNMLQSILGVNGARAFKKKKASDFSTQCFTYCIHHDSKGYEYTLCLMVYSRDEDKCDFYIDSKEALKNLLEITFETSAEPGAIGQSILIYTSDTARAFLKYIRLHSGITMADLQLHPEGKVLPERDEL